MRELQRRLEASPSVTATISSDKKDADHA
jgi:hypothetical protein